MPTLAFRLCIRDAGDAVDEFIITSVPEAADPENQHNYLTEPPSVDGSSADLVQGTTDVGSATIKFWDELLTASARTRLAVDDFESYQYSNFTGGADGDPTAFVRPDRWSRVSQPAGLEAMTGVVQGAAVYDGVKAYSHAGSIDAVGIGGSAYIQRSDWSEFALPPDTIVVVTCRTYPYLWLGYLAPDPDDPDWPWTYPTFGLRVEGAALPLGTSFPDTSYWPDPPVWLVRSVVAKTRSDGTLDVQLGHFEFLNVGCLRGFLADRVEIWSAGEQRILTRGLYDIVDLVPRIALLSRKARIEQSTDGGETWTAVHRGSLNRLEVEGGEWTVTVGDTTRREQQTELFAALPTFLPVSLGLPLPAPRVGLILGGPIASDPTYGPFAGITDYGPTRWKVEETLLDHAGDDRMVRLKFVSGYLRPWYYASRARFDQDEWEKVNNAGRDYFVWDPAKYESHPYPLSTVNSFGYFPDLVARLTPVGGGTALEKMPIARPIKHEPDDKHTPKAEYDALTGNDSVLYLDWTNDEDGAPFPDVNDEYDVTLYSPVISERNPLLLAGHPIDLVAYAASLSGIAWNSASRIAARAALGEGLWCELTITGAQKFADFQKELGGFFGFLFRPNLTTDERHFVPTRVRPASPEFQISNDDRVGGDGGDASLPPVWAVEEDSVVNVVTFATKRFRFFRYKEDSGDPPVHMMAEATAEVEGKRVDLTVNGDRTLRYTIPGQLQRRAADGAVAPLVLVTRDPDNPGYAEDAGGILVDYAGWGVAQTVVEIDAESPAASAQVGAEGTLYLPDLPVPNVNAVPVTQRGLGTRVVRVVKRDPLIGAVRLTLVHAGELLQSQTAVDAPTSSGSGVPGTPELPTLLLAASSTAPTTVVTVTLTNGADLGADNLRTELRYVVQPTPPDADEEGTEFGPVTSYPNGDATTIDTPAVPPGSTVHVGARSVNVTSNVASAWTAWTAYTLDPVENGGGGPGETPYAPTLSVSALVDPTTGDVTATANASASAVSVKFAIGAVGGTPPSLADVRAATADSSAPFASGTLATLTAGQVRTVGALAYDAVGNESAMATDKVAVGAELEAIPFDLNLGELGDGTTDLTTGEREFVAIVSVEGTVEGWTCDGDDGDVTLDVETAPVVDGVDFVWTTRCTTGSDQRPSFSGTAPTAVTLSGANAFTLTGRTALRLTVAAASGGATVVRLALHGTRS